MDGVSARPTLAPAGVGRIDFPWPGVAGLRERKARAGVELGGKAMNGEITESTTLGELWAVIGALSDICASAGAHLPEEELKALQVGKVAEEAGEAIHALHGLKGLTTCDDKHDWGEVTNDLVGAVLAAMIALRYVNGEKAPEEFSKILLRRTRRGREALEAAAA